MMRKCHRTGNSPAFVLVLTLFLMVLLASTGAAIAVSASTESVLAGGVAMDLEHELAVDSFLTIFPQLQSHADVPTGEMATRSAPRLNAAYGRVRLTARIVKDRARLQISDTKDGDAAAPQLKAIAREHGLVEGNVKPRPIMDDAHRSQFGAYVWFDQLISQTEFEEVFRWSFNESPAADPPEKKSVWSDVIGFWGDDVTYIELETSVGDESRRWFIVIPDDAGEAHTLVRERI